MKLYEFFGPAIDASKKVSPDKDHDKRLDDELFWFILDHDKLHKDYFHPIAAKIKKQHKNNKLNKEQLVKEFMPMVERGCKEFYYKKKMSGRLGKLFPKDLREEMCEKLYDHYCQDILKDQYQLSTENSDQGGGKMFGNTANKSQTGNDYTSSAHLRYDNGGIA